MLMHDAVSLLDLVPLRPRTKANYLSRFNTHIDPRWHDVDLDDITRQDVQLFVLTLTPPTARMCLAILKTIYRTANELDLATTNPTTVRVQSYRPSTSYVPWEVLQSKEFGHYTGLIRFLALHGLRWSEAMALEPTDVVDGYVRVYRTWQDEYLPTKNLQTRHVPLIEPVALPFRSPSGRRVNLSNVRNRYWLPTVGQYRIHSLRATYATLLKDRGVHPSVAQALLGHNDIRMTLQTYTKVAVTDLEHVRTQLSLTL